MKYLLFLLISCGLTTLRPKLEIKKAGAAFMAASKAGAEEKATADFRKAEYYYLKASSAYRRKYFNDAKKYAETSIKFSERAEYISVRASFME